MIRATEHLSRSDIPILVIFGTWLAVTPIVNSDVFATIIESEKLYHASLNGNDDIQSNEIMAVINFNRQSILEQNGANLNYAWLTVNGQRYDNGTYYDTSDWVYDDDVEERGINAQPLERILILPYSLQSDQQIEVCLQDDEDYQSCQTVSNSGNRPEAINFVYPASTSSIREKSETAGDSIVDRQNGRYYEGFDWQGVCRNPLIRNYISQPCEVLVTSDGNALTSQGKQSMDVTCWW